MTCLCFSDVFPIPIRLPAGIVDCFIYPPAEQTHGLKFAIAVGLDDFRSLELVGPRRLPYAVLLSKIADLRRSIYTVFGTYHAEFRALNPTVLFTDLVISHANDAETAILNGLDR
jgi:hypothetical protein